MDQQWKWLDRLFFSLFIGIIACATLIYLFETDAGAVKAEACVEINPEGRLDLGLNEDERLEPLILDRVRLDVPLLNQMDTPQLYNGCEVTSLAMIFNYYDQKVTKNELADQLPSSPYRSDGLYGNPNQGFVGDMSGNGGPGYFVYHEPIFELAKEFAGEELEVIDLTGASFSTIQEYLSQKAPVWVITTTTFSATQDNQVWQTNEGDVTISMSEHSVVLTGYNDKEVYLNDPYGNKNFATNLERFIASWQQLGSQAITIMRK